jgi:hypothetical protein
MQINDTSSIIQYLKRLKIATTHFVIFVIEDCEIGPFAKFRKVRSQIIHRVLEFRRG